VVLTFKDFYIPSKPYLTKKLDHNTLVKLLDSSYFVVDGIYLIANQADTNIDIFNEVTVGDYKIKAYVKVNYAYAAQARAQVANLKPFRRLIHKRPSYDLRINIYNTEDKQVYHFSQRFTRINRLIDIINIQHSAINRFLSDKKLKQK